MLTTKHEGGTSDDVGIAISQAASRGLARAPPTSCLTECFSRAMPWQKFSTQRTPSNPSSPLLMPQRLPSDSASKLLQQLCETKIHAEQALEFLERVILKYSISEGNSLTRDNSQDDGLSDEEVDLTTRALIHVLEQSLLVPARVGEGEESDMLQLVLHLCSVCCAWPRFKRSLMCGHLVSKLLPILSEHCASRFALHIFQILTDLTVEDDFRLWTCADEAINVIKHAIQYLQEENLEIPAREQVLRAVRNLALDELLRDAFVSNSGVEVLVMVCESTASEMLKEQAARAMGNIAMSAANEERIVAAGGVELLVGFLRSSDKDLLNATLGALANLISNSEMRQRFVSAGGVQVLGQ